jgi:hypothetical protein
MKKCRKCEKEKALNNFSKWKSGKDGLSHYCKECVSKKSKEYFDKNREEILRRQKEQRLNNPERFKKNNRETYARYKEKYIEKQRVYNDDNREKINERQRIYNLKNKEEINEKQRKFWNSEEGNQYANEYYHRTKEKFDSKIKARNKLRYAVKVGKIMKPEKCENCVINENIHGHHEDYNKPLEVVWLCSYCHKKEHKKQGN